MLTFADVRLGRGRAYEDYHFNSQLAAAGYEFTIARNTILFYRWRKGLLHDMNAASTKQIPRTPLYDPPVYLQRCRKTYDTYEASGQPAFDPEAIWDRFNSNPACLEFIHAANAIEPAIAPWINSRPFVWTNISIDRSRGAAYYRACLLVGNAKFTDVFLFPFIVRGGGDKYILNVMHGISQIDPQSKFLVLTGQRIEQHQWLHLLPDNALFVDIQELGKDLTEADVDVITLRLIDSTAPTARIHVKQSPYAQRFVSQFGHLLENNKLVFYRFCDEEFVVEGLSFVTGYAFDFLSNCGEQFNLIIADHRRIAEFDRSRLDCLKHKIRVLYTKNDVLTNQEAIERRGSCLRKRLLWASRFDRQKRPDLLLRIASRLAEIGSDVHIDVYGAPILGGFDTAKLTSTKNLTVKGPFENFDSIEHDLYDALLYTSSFDGLPIIILDALAAGLPVIATDIGGIDDAVIDGRTGFLIPRSSDDDVLIASYIDAIRRLYEKPEAYVPMRMNAVSQIVHHHAPAAFLANLADVFGLKQ
jgi:glycosyltransferase involved in cell wall biosynthesis